MADDDLDDDLDDGGSPEAGEDAGPPRSSKKKLIILIVVPLLLVVGGFAAAYFLGALDPLLEMILGPAEHTEGEAEPGKSTDTVTFMPLPEMLVTLNTGGRKASYLKIRVRLELANASAEAKITEKLPRVLDNFQVYLRELRIEDLKGSDGMYRLREELLKRVNTAVAPVQVNDVLFEEMLVQ